MVEKPGAHNWGLCNLCDSDDHINFGPVSLIGDVKEPPRMTCTLAVTTLIGSIERSAW